MNNITIIQHSVLHWRPNKDSLTRNFIQTKADIILIKQSRPQGNRLTENPPQKKEINEQEMYNMIREGRVNLQGSGKGVKSSTFRKIRPGLLKDRSPLGSRDPRLRRTSHHE